jgi:glycosyltransferase involved in cell wall biosynthesis
MGANAGREGATQPMRMLVIQSGEFEDVLAAAQAGARRYSPAELVALVKAPDAPRAGAAGLFTAVHPLPDAPGDVVGMDLWKTPFDLCLVPFDDALGIYHFTARRIPISQDIRTIVSCNRRGRLREYGRLGWLVNTAVICLGLRALHAPLAWAWKLMPRRGLDMAALHVLALAALPLGWLKARHAHPLDRAVARRLSQGRRRVSFLIPTMGLGGAQRQLLAVLKHLDRTQWEPELLMLDDPDKFFDPEVRELGVPITYLNDRRRGYWMLPVTWRIFRHLRGRPCHVLHGWLHYAAAWGAIAGTLAGIPVIVGSLRSERPARMPWFFSRWQRGLDILTAPLQTCLIANSDAVRREHRQWAFVPDRKFRTIYNGIGVNGVPAADGVQRARLRTELRLPPEAPCIGTIGRLSPEKDHVTFLRAARLILAGKPEARFLIAGSGPLRAAVESEVARLGLDGRVLLLGDRKDVRELLGLMDVFVLTSTTEGLPNTLLEAAAAGVPAVTTAAGGAVEVVVDGETGFVVPCGDADAVAGRVLLLLDDPALRKQCAEAGRERMRACFSVERMVAAVERCYRGEPALSGMMEPAAREHA